MDANDLKFWLGFSAFDGIGPVRFKLLYDYFGSAKNAWNAKELDLRKINLGEKLTAKFIHFRTNFPFEKILATLKDKKITVITRADKRYPKLLSEIADPPIVLYVRGDLSVLAPTLQNRVQPCIGVVGTRKITHYGEEVTRKIVVGLASAGVTIISGMAYGVDTVAHESAIAAGGKTIAVLGCGVDVIYPKSNEKLYWDIIKKHGAVISEFPPGMITAVGLFPSRNRIISGLSLGIVVTEGARDSGALITAKAALEQGREVFAVPGPITSSMSDAPTILLKQGAKLVTEARDILDELKINPNIKIQILNKIKNPNFQMELTREEKTVFELLENESLHFDELVRKSALPAAELGGLLTMMEMKNFIKHTSDGNYCLTSL